MTRVDGDVSPDDTGGVAGNDGEHVFHDLRGVPFRHEESVESQHPDLCGVSFSVRPRQEGKWAQPCRTHLVSGKNTRVSIGIIPAVLSIKLNLEYGKSADVGLPYGIPYLKGSNCNDVVIGGNQPVHVAVSVNFGNRLVNHLDIFSGLFHNRLRLCKFATFGGCRA